MLDKFPQVSISMKNVKIYGSLESHKEKLAELEQIHFTMSLVDLIRKNYKINAIYLEEGFINLFVNKNGENNYTFIDSKASTEQQKLNFDIKEISIANTEIIYENLKLEQNHRFYAYNLDGALSINDDATDVIISTKSEIQKIESEGNKLLQNKNIEFESKLSINTTKKTVEIPETEIKIEESTFKANTNVNYELNTYSSSIKASNTDFKTIISLLPNNISKPLQKYDSKGIANFLLKVDKQNEKTENPKITVDFGCKNVSLIETNTNKKIENLSFSGRFSNGKNQNNSSSILNLKNLNGSFDSNPFEGHLSYTNFENPYIDAYLKGNFPIEFFLQFNDENNLNDVSGSAKIDVKIKALQKDLVENNQEKITSSGEIILENAAFANDNQFYKFKNLNGSFIFNKKDIAFSDFKGKVNNSDFVLNGYLQGFFDYFFNKKGKLNVLADLKSNRIDFDKLVETSSNSDTLQEIDNEYLKNIRFTIDANVKKVKWGKFNFRNVSGNLSHNNLVFNSQKIVAETGSGGFVLSGSLNSQDKNNIKLFSNTTINKIEIDSIFYYFDDFNEDFITHKNLKGNLYLTSTTRMIFDKYLNVKPESIVSDLDIKVINGKLLDFEPMQNMSKFIDEDDLRNIHFSELRDKIHIENEKIEIPELSINSSVSNIKLKGSHTFDQKIYYKLKVPVKNLKKSKREEAESAYEDGKDGPTIHLIISGTTDDFEIKYDKKATQKIVEEKVKDEVNTIKEIIKGEYEEEEEEQVGLEEDEFFDFDSDSTEF